ncbi:MAG TPA: hypothetical protein VLB84_17320 [Bacteroidia bacterium]|nr:hypothetical protein [Bacteroidia bacterium]
MAKCKLCKENEADQTGSHILSCLSIKSMIGERGEEKSYLISPDPTENYRKNIKASEIIEDYILCRSCEQRLGYVEGYIAAELTNKIRKQNFKQSFPLKKLEDINYVECQKLNPMAFHIFLYSLMWRASISSTKIFKDFRLKNETQEYLRNTLNEIIPPRTDYRGVTLSHKEWFSQLKLKKDSFDKIKYLLLSTPQIEDTTGDFVIFHPTFNNPYGVMLNEWIIYFDVKENSTEDLFDQLNKHDKSELLNSSDNLIKIIQIDYEKWNAIRKRLIHTLKDQKKQNMRLHFTASYLQRFGYVPHPQLIDSLITDFIERLKEDNSSD